MHIALITHGIWPYVMGGMQKHSYYLCKYLAQRGVQVDLYHINGGDAYDIDRLEFFTAAEKQQITAFVVSAVTTDDRLPGHYLRSSRKQSEAIFDLYQQNNRPVDLIYTKGLAGWAFVAAKQKGALLPPLMLNVHGYEMYQKAPSFKVRLQHWMLRPVFKYLNQQADYVFSYGGKITDIITQRLGVSRDKVVEIPTGIGADWLSQQAELEVSTLRKFVFLGRYERRKGVEELTAVLKAILSGSSFTFDFIGPIPDEKKIASEQIRYHGVIADKTRIQQLLSQADVLVVPSYAEGMPNVILEGMASACAIIATDVGAVALQVDTTNGWLISPGSKRSLQAAMEEAINCSKGVLREKKRVSLTRVQEQFLWSGIIDTHLRAFRTVISREA